MASQPDSTSLLGRISNVITEIELDCECRARVRDAIARFEDLERSRQAHRALATARDQRQRIAALLALLADLDEIGWDELDSSIYLELSDLFNDIAEAAEAGAAATRSLHHPPPCAQEVARAGGDGTAA